MDHPSSSARKTAHTRLVLLVLLGRLAEQPARAAEFERSDALEQRLLERAADGHHLPHRLHLRREGLVGLGELLEGPARDLHDHVVDRRLEGGRRHARDVVGDLVEAVAQRELGRDLGDGKPGGLGRQRRGARHPRVHLDGHHAARDRVDGELDVAAARLDADAPDDAAARVAHPLVLAVGERQGRRHGDAVAGVHPHWIDVLDRADDDEVVRAVAHHLELELLPADHRLLDEYLVHGAQLDAARDGVAELLDVVGDAAADAAQRERGPDDGRKPHVVHDLERLGHGADHRAAGHVDADLAHRVAEEQAVLGHFDGGNLRADQRHPVAVQHAAFGERHGEVQRRLAAHGGQHRVGPFPLDDPFHHLGRERLHVGALGQLRIGHDRRGVGVDQHHLEALVAQRLARLGARVVELAGLADHDRAGADHQDAVEVGAPWHG
jgi:hypothetical protein